MLNSHIICVAICFFFFSSGKFLNIRKYARVKDLTNIMSGCSHFGKWSKAQKFPETAQVCCSLMSDYSLLLFKLFFWLKIGAVYYAGSGNSTSSLMFAEVAVLQQSNLLFAQSCLILH